MGWRADQAYEEEERRAFREWKATLSWGEYAAWQWQRWRAFLAGVVAAGILIAGVVWVCGLGPFAAQAAATLAGNSLSP